MTDTRAADPAGTDPAEEDRARREAVLEQLDRLDEVALEGEPDTLLPLARGELHRLTEGLRTLLDEHQPDENGRCRVCPGSLRTRRWPCSVWTTAHQQLIGEHADEAGRANRSRLDALRKPATDTDGTAGNGPGREAEPPVLPRTVTGSGNGGPGDWDTDEFALPGHANDRGSDSTRSTGDHPGAPPIGGHLETDHTRIHRASVVDRPITWPPPRHRRT